MLATLLTTVMVPLMSGGLVDGNVAVHTQMLTTSVAWVQPDPQPSTQPDDPPESLELTRPGQDPPAVGNHRDPTQVGGELREVLDPNTGQPVVTGQTPPPPPIKLPPMALRGRVVMKGRPAVAMVEIDGDLIMVKEGDQFTVMTKTGAPLALKVATLNANSLWIEAVDLNRTVMVP